ncbi:ECF transporter S component [Antribacter gilvus]|uniref:ECF transporter S component n=1 Tax=Antribacter gilvus TaxID=2304675 RepID=UPI0013DF4506|nr:ECF transporter S component [Antribacter gilvus]
MTTPTAGPARFSTRLLLSCAAIGAAGGLLAVVINYLLALVPPSPLAYAVYTATIGVWALGPLVAVSLFRVPGVGLLTAVFAGVVNLVAPTGFLQVVNFLAAGVVLELPFLVMLYRRWSDRYVRNASVVALVLGSAGYYTSCALAGLFPASFYPWGALATLAATVALAIGVTLLAQRVAVQLARQGLGRRQPATVVVAADE